MDLMERTNEKRRTLMKDRLEHKLDDTMRENARLEEANGLLREELNREQRERDHMWSAIEKGIRPQRSRFRRLIVLGAGLGAAYVYGAKAGRSRYDEIATWWERTRGRAEDLQTEAQRSLSTKADEFAGKVERASSSASEKIETTGQQAASTVRNTARDATTGDAR